MGVGVVREEVSAALRADDHCGDRILSSGERAGVLAEAVAGGAVRDAAEITVERAVEGEGLPQRDGNGEEELSVRDDWEHFFDHALGPLKGPALRTGTGRSPALPGTACRREMPCLGGEGDEACALVLAVRVGGVEWEKAEVHIARPEESL